MNNEFEFEAYLIIEQDLSMMPVTIRGTHDDFDVYVTVNGKEYALWNNLDAMTRQQVVDRYEEYVLECQAAEAEYKLKEEV